jgi:hypothetical protein
MKSKNFMGVILVVAIAGGGIWWFMQPPTATSGKIVAAPAPTPAKADAPKPMAQAIGIAPPKASPLQAKPATTAVASGSGADASSNADPQADLKTAIPDMARLVRVSELTWYETYTAPKDIDPDTIKNLEDVQATTNPDTHVSVGKLNEAFAQSYEALETQTPTYNAAGDEATYDGYISPSSRDMESGTFSGNGPRGSLTFIKIDGKWYKKDD